MYVESILNQIKHTVEDIEFIAKDNSDGIVGMDISCTDGIVFGVKFRDEAERGLLWNELSETPPVPFVQIGNTFVRVKHLRVVKAEKHQGHHAIILQFTSPATIVRPYEDVSIFTKDYSVLIQLLSHYQDQRANVSFAKTKQ